MKKLSILTAFCAFFGLFCLTACKEQPQTEQPKQKIEEMFPPLPKPELRPKFFKQFH